MADRRSSTTITAVVVLLLATVLWRVANRPRQARAPVTHGSALPGAGVSLPDSLNRSPDSAALLAANPSTDTAGAPAPPPDSVVMNVPEGYLDQLARAQTRRQLRASAATTYLNEIVAESPDSALHRWDNRFSDPVRVYLASDTVENYEPAFQDAVRSALDRWAQVGLPVRFVLVGDSTRAEVVFGWRRQFDIDRTGQTDLTWDRDGHVLTALVTIATFDPSNHPMGVEDVRVVALHEVGHLLGLNHSSDSTDIMYGHTVAHDLSLRDESTARLLYDLPPGSLK